MPQACYSCNRNFLRSFACAFDRFNATAGRSPARFVSALHTPDLAKFFLRGPSGKPLLRGTQRADKPFKNLPWGTVLNFAPRGRQVLIEAPERVMPRVY